ncbi:hypothetical protein CapIbe_016446 [Capra ibex]
MGGPGGRDNRPGLGHSPQSHLGLRAVQIRPPPPRAHARSHLTAGGVRTGRPTAPPIGRSPPTNVQLLVPDTT